MSDSPSADSSASDDSGPGNRAAFEQIDWEDVDGSRRLLSAERIALVLGLAVFGLVYLYYQNYRRTNLVYQWNVGGADWLMMLAVVVIVAYGVVPLARDPARVRRVLGRLRSRIPTALSLVLLLALLGFSLWVLIRGFEPSLGNVEDGWQFHKFQPPIGASVPYDQTNLDCVGSVTGDTTDFHSERDCTGTWEYPLGTDNWGYDMTDLLLAGTKPFALLALITVGLIVPLATLVGMAAGYYGGLVDDTLMAYVDIQLAIPAIILYMVSYMFNQNSMFFLVLAFGLLSWGGIARIVRSETLQRREDGYVLSARAIGAPNSYVLRHHLFPNVTNTVIPATFHLIAILVLTEAGLAFIGFHATFQSWGMTMSEGIFYGGTSAWWNSALPALALTLTVVSLKVAGDGFRDILDPRRQS